MNRHDVTGRRRLVYIVTVPQTFFMLEGQARYMAANGFELFGISSAGPYQEHFRAREPVTLVTVEMPRRITPLKDLVALFHLVRAIRRIRPAIVHSHTPKGGLLGTIAATVARVPVRIYHMHGLPLMTATGARRRLLAMTERVSCRLATRVFCVSHSVRAFAVEDGICPADKITTLLGGTSNGIDANGAFDPDTPPGDVARRRAQIRSQYEIPNDAIVVGYLGRLVRDKGIVELADAWRSITDRHPTAYLLMAGPEEPQDPVPPATLAFLAGHPRVRMMGQTNDPRAVYAASDVITLPSFREGMPNVPLEAAAMNLPVVATRIPGTVDAVADGETGILVPPRDATSLAAAIERYLDDADLRVRHGHSGRARVLRAFRQDAIWNATRAEYEQLLATTGTVRQNR